MSSSLVESKNLDHLGLVAAMYDELGIGSVIDEAIEQDIAFFKFDFIRRKQP